VKNEENLVMQVEKLFDDGSKAQMKTSSNAKFVSLSHKQVMMSAAAIIKIYKQASQIEGIIAL
jgi:hypothetical protein